jgi:hypothetical protein
VLIAVFAVFAIANVLNYLCLREKNKGPDFSLMFDKDQIDKLIDESTKYLQTYPNHMNALYFGAKGLIIKKRFSEAKKQLGKLSSIEPSLTEEYKDMVEYCIENEAS